MPVVTQHVSSRLDVACHGSCMSVDGKTNYTKNNDTV